MGATRFLSGPRSGAARPAVADALHLRSHFLCQIDAFPLSGGREQLSNQELL
jgi:hypothetical protein